MGNCNDRAASLLLCTQLLRIGSEEAFPPIKTMVKKCFENGLRKSETKGKTGALRDLQGQSASHAADQLRQPKNPSSGRA